MLRPGVRQWSWLAIAILFAAPLVLAGVVRGEEPAPPKEAQEVQPAADAAAPPATPEEAAPEFKGAPLLQQAMEVKLSAESLADLNQVIKLSQEAIEAGLPEGDIAFANELLASTLSQRAELVCHELFETRITPGRGQALLRMALADLEKTVELNSEQPEAQFLLGRLYAHLAQTEKALTALNAAVRLSGTTRRPRARR
jgi:tetratricopeptide (TPR) repeat protein